MTHQKHRSAPRPVGSNADDLTEAALGAEKMISRMQDIVTEAIQPGGDTEEGFNALIEELDPAPEGEALRDALGMDAYGSRQLPRGGKAAAQSGEAKPDDKPVEYQTWRTGP
jgi:hypothetical protein